MSAIVGLYSTCGQPVDKSDLVKMLDSLAHRGSDGAGIWSEGPVGLGHRIQWTTPESLNEQQPLSNISKDLIITADARIDNREELMAALSLSRANSFSLADSQLILAAYEKWGETWFAQVQQRAGIANFTTNGQASHPAGTSEL